MEVRTKKPYVSPEDQMRGVPMHEIGEEYVPPVGPGSKSLPPIGSYRDPEVTAVRGLLRYRD